jgi:ABC-type lipoprotein release transport system permease subunit
LQSANGLVHIPPGDPFAYAVALALLTITAGTAALIPALRAAGDDPWRALSRE